MRAKLQYYGVQATKTFAKLKGMIQEALAKVKGVIKGRDVAPQEVAAIAESHRPLGKAAAAGEALDRRIAQYIWLKARVEHLDVGVGIPDRRLRRPGRTAARIAIRRRGAGDHE